MSTCRELVCFFKVGDNALEGDDLVDKSISNIFALFWKAITLPAEKAVTTNLIYKLDI